MSLIVCRLIVDSAAKGLSQEAFAFEAGIHRTYVSDLERGARNPSITILDKLALPLGVSASDLVGGPPQA
jgi:transcriptional regulator with XRE-family HTH domain